MEERFQILAPHAMQRGGPAGDIEELLFTGNDFLVQMLTIPVKHKQEASIRPRDTFQFTTVSVAQEKSHGTIEAEPTKRKAEAETLQSPQRLQKRVKCKNSAAKTQPATLSDLPTEIHHNIFRHLESLEDAVSLGLVNQHFFLLAPEHVHNRVAEQRGLWTYESLVCVGEDTEPDDFPPGLYDDSELETYNMLFAGGDGFGDTTVSLHHLAENAERPPDPYTTSDTRRIGSKFCLSPGVTPAMLSKLGLPQCDDDWDRYFPKDQPWILRNFTTKEFVRAEAIALEPEYIHGPNIDRLGFGEVVLSRIFWSSSGNGIEGSEDLCRGVWAGHCFDITTLAQHQEEMGDEAGWTDASDEVAAELATILESNYGDDWRETFLVFSDDEDEDSWL